MFKNKKVGIFIRPNSDNLQDVYLQVKKYFLKQNIEVICEKKSSKLVNEDGLDFNELCKIADILISIGGDGTLISLIRESLKYQKPILGISAGRLGFLTDIKPNECEDFILKMIDGNIRIDKRATLEVIYKDNIFYAVNDIVISKSLIKSMITVDVYTNDEKIDSYFGDGVIFSTPTGSTAYNLSANGPILYPFIDAFVITPICSHSLRARPLVLPKEFEVTCKANEDSIVIFDGQNDIYLKANECIKIKISSIQANMIHRIEKNYFKILNNKLHWGK
jgi:NAD+ kinase